MLNLKVLENLRTKEEVKEYLMSIGYNADEEAIENLKKQYKTTNNANNNLTMFELDQVAGGALSLFAFWGTKIAKYTLTKQFDMMDYGVYINTSGIGYFYSYHCKNQRYLLIYDGLLGKLGIGRVINISDMSAKLLNEIASLANNNIASAKEICDRHKKTDEKTLLRENTSQLADVFNFLNQERNPSLPAIAIALFTNFVNRVTSPNYSHIVAENSNYC